MSQLRKWYSAVCLFLILVMTSVNVNADTKVLKHHQIMAGFLLHFTSFTQWPTSDSANIQLCILGEDPFKDYLDDMVKRRPKNRAGQLITINRIKEANGENLNACHIVYVQPQDYNQLWENIASQHHALLVSNADSFIALGGMVNFAMKNKKVKLEVNLVAVEAAKIKISSELLKHAKVIAGEPHQKYDGEHIINVQ